MKKGIFLAVVAALGFGIYVYAQDKTKSVMPVAKEVPKAMAREDAMKLTDEEWKKRLTPEQYRILRQAGTERSNGQIYKEFKAQGGGTYHCAGCGTELFSSKEKFDSNCGWPSFFDPSKDKVIIESGMKYFINTGSVGQPVSYTHLTLPTICSV